MIYSMKINNVVISRNVRFCENIFPYNDNFSETIETNSEVTDLSSDSNDRKETSQEKGKLDKRRHKQPACLKDYHRALLKNEDLKKLEEKDMYPLPSVLNYDMFSKSHMAYSLALVTDTKLKNYKAVVHDIN